MGKLSQFYKKNGIDFEIFNFADNIVNYYLKSNLVITRAGASVLGELVNVKTLSLQYLYPHQLIIINIKTLSFIEKKGYGYLLEEKDIKNNLYNLINTIFNDKSLLKKFYQIKDNIQTKIYLKI